MCIMSEIIDVIQANFAADQVVRRTHFENGHTVSYLQIFTNPNPCRYWRIEHVGDYVLVIDPHTTFSVGTTLIEIADPRLFEKIAEVMRD